MEENKLGFTLIELLVIIAIIGILSMMVFVNLKNAQQKAQDIKEINNLAQIKTTLEMYNVYNEGYPCDVEGQSPPYSCSNPPSCYLDSGNICADCSSSGTNIFLAQLAEEGIISQEKISGFFGDSPDLYTCYYYSKDLQRYKFVVILNNSDKMENDGGINNNFYETGNDLSIPFLTNPCLYKSC